ncbi:MAG: GNAT family N-acetyltransferase [Methanothrix sp.]|nr:GNAT family N-acetyltransferase [Methanothrix sp.]
MDETFCRCNPQSLQLGKFCRSDLMPLLHLIHTTVDLCYSGVYPPRAVHFFKEYHGEKEIISRSEVGTILVALHDGRLAATGALVENEITGVFVASSMQGQGLGRMIMKELEDLAWSRGCRMVELSVSLPSRGFYEALGYELLSECALDVGDGQKLTFWRARKALSPR